MDILKDVSHRDHRVLHPLALSNRLSSERTEKIPKTLRGLCVLSLRPLCEILCLPSLLHEIHELSGLDR